MAEAAGACQLGKGFNLFLSSNGNWLQNALGQRVLETGKLLCIMCQHFLADMIGNHKPASMPLDQIQAIDRQKIDQHGGIGQNDR